MTNAVRRRTDLPERDDHFHDMARQVKEAAPDWLGFAWFTPNTSKVYAHRIRKGDIAALPPEHYEARARTQDGETLLWVRWVG